MYLRTIFLYFYQCLVPFFLSPSFSFSFRLSSATPVIFSPVQTPPGSGYGGPQDNELAPVGGYGGPQGPPQTGYGGPQGPPQAEYGSPAPQDQYAAGGDLREGRRGRQFGRQGRRFNNNRRNNSRRNGRRQQSRRGRQENLENPNTLYGAPAAPPPAEYGASSAPLPSYGLAPQGYTDDLPSYGNRRSSASNLVPVYVPSSRNGRAQFYQLY